MTHSNKLARPVLDRHYRSAIKDLLTSLRAAPIVSKGSSDLVCNVEFAEFPSLDFNPSQDILVSLIVELLGVPADRVDFANGNLRQLGADSLAALRLSNAIRDRLSAHAKLSCVCW